MEIVCWILHNKLSEKYRLLKIQKDIFVKENNDTGTLKTYFFRLRRADIVHCNLNMEYHKPIRGSAVRIN